VTDIGKMDSTSFKNNMIEWDELKSSSKKYQDGIKKLKDRLKVLQEENIKYMQSMEIDACNLEDGQISLRRTTRKIIDIKKSNLQPMLLDFFQSKGESEHTAKQTVEEIAKFMEKNYSKSTESLTLTRTFNK
jgi:hypothetical protein